MAVLFLLAAGCGFHAVGNGDGGDNDMGLSGNDDLAGAPDLYGVPPGSDLSMVSGGGCAPPLLLVGVENLHNGDTGGGRVARLSLTAAGVKQCTTLSGQGLIGPQPLAVAGMLGGIGAATIDGLYFVDPATDTVKWSKPAPQVSGWLPLEAFSILNPQGTAVMAVAYGMSGNPSTIREVDAFTADGTSATGAQPWCIQGSGCTLPLSLGILSVTATPTDLTHFFALDDSSPGTAAWDVDPWANPPTKTQYIGAYTENLGSIYAVVVGHPGPARYAWLDQSMSTGSIQYATDSGGGPSTLGGPIKCASGCTTLLHVVPDPTTSDGFFALCDGATVDARTVVRLDSTLSCTQVLDGKPFGAESRLSRLGILE